MGSCMGGNGTINVQRHNIYKGADKSIGCLTSLCKGEDNLEDNKNASEIVPYPIKSTFSINHNDDTLNNDLNIFIKKYKDKIKIEKINFVQIYNIFMNYKYDFTRSNFILCDTRDDPHEKIQIFLKKFPQINFSIKQLESMDENRLNKFFRFLYKKKIIFILKETKESKEENSIDIIEKYIIFFLVNNAKINIDSVYILSQYIINIDEKYINNNDNKDISYSEYLNYFINEDLLYIYSPKILINSNDIKSSNINITPDNINNAFIFYDIFPHYENKEFNKKNNIILNTKFELNYLSNKSTEENDIYLNFISKFKIIYIINFIIIEDLDYNSGKKHSKLIWHSEFKRNKAFKEDKKVFVKQKSILIPKNIEFDTFYKIIHSEFIPLLDELKEQIIQNNCILIQFDENIEYFFLMKFIYIIIFRITGLNFDETYEYLNLIFFDLNNESSVKDKKNEFLNVLT